MSTVNPLRLLDPNTYIVVTRPGVSGQHFVKELKNCGLLAFYLPTINFIKFKLTLEDQQFLKNISLFDWIIITSQNGVHYLFETLEDLGISKGSFDKIKIAVIGSETAKYARSQNLRVSLIPESYSAADLTQALGDLSGQKILLPRSNLANPKLVKMLQGTGAEVVNLVVYKTEILNKIDRRLSQHLRANRVGCVTFTSPSTITGFINTVDKDLKDQALNLTAVCIGPETAQAARAFRFKHVLVSKVHTQAGMMVEIQDLAGVV